MTGSPRNPSVEPMTLEEALRRANDLEQYDFCYCAGARDFEAVKFLAAYITTQRNLGG